MNKKEVVVKYDLEHMPITYDSAYYLTNSVLLLRDSGYSKFYIWVKNKQFRRRTKRDYDMSEAEKSWRLENLIVPVCNRLIGCRGVFTSEYPPNIGAPTFPEQFNLPSIGYSASVTGNLNKLTGITPVQYDSSNWAKKKVRERLGPDGINSVSITLRQSKYFSHRNTSSEVVAQLAEYLMEKGKQLIVVPDNESNCDIPNDWRKKNAVSVPEIANSLDLRLALYQWCGLNIGPSNGPIAMSFLTKNVRMLQFDLLKSDHTGLGVETGWEQTNGFPVGQNFPWAENGSRLCWDDLNFQNIQRHIELDEDSLP